MKNGKKMVTKLSERTMKDVCKCENCGTEPLAHFEECPKCFSEAYHLTIEQGKDDEEEKGLVV